MKLKDYTPPTRVDMASWQDQMRAAFFQGVTPDDMRDVIRKLVADAKAGDKTAVKILLTYAIGSPTVTVNAGAVAIVGANPYPLPSAPTDQPPGSPGKLDVLAQRAAAGQPLHHPRDHKEANS